MRRAALEPVDRVAVGEARSGQRQHRFRKVVGDLRAARDGDGAKQNETAKDARKHRFVPFFSPHEYLTRICFNAMLSV